MPSFYFKAADRQGRVIEGHETAASQESVTSLLRSRGLIPVAVSLSMPTDAAGSSESGSLSIKSDAVFSFTRELAILLKAGMPLDRSLKLLEEMAARVDVKALLKDLRQQVKQGKGLSQALLRHEAVFGPFYINMLKSGEASGQLAEVLTNLSDHLEQVKVLGDTVKSALIYPAILVMFAILSMVVMIGFVIPQFDSLFADMGEALPLPTRVLIGLGDLVQAWGWLIILCTAALVWGGKRWSATVAGRYWWQQRLLALPLLGPLLHTYQLSRFTRALGTLLKNGVPLVKALAIATDTVTYQSVREKLLPLIPAVKQGKRVSATLQETGGFSPVMVQMVRVGEESGRLDEILLKLSVIYDEQVKTGMKRALTLIEPLLILGLGAIIALMIVSMLLGILSVNDFII